jgi:hypothetical protein
MSAGKPKQGLAVASLVLGILSLVGLLVVIGAVLGPPAVITGHLARRRVRKAPEQYAGKRLALAGLITGYLSMGLAAAAVVFLATMIPRVTRMQKDFAVDRCVANLKEIGQAARIVSEDNKYRFPDSFLQMSNELRNPNVLICPADPARRGGARGWNETNISYEFLEPGIQETPDTMGRIVFRCPIHGHVVTVDGAVRAGALSPQPETEAGP